ncbi:allantoate deiminase [Sporolactobacillus terrae]|uniref:allantoate deiminase n=1 Tax=Sporolactobacillus terrae TaxID=269673 RepID=UPI001118CF9D|nr:allantoate deiminase [Sporolactobacillus terrae]
MMDQASTTLKDDLRQAINWLASFGKTENDGVTRLLYDEAWQQAQQALAQKMNNSGLLVRFDDVGNLFGRLPGTEDKAPVILTGSHLDTVVDGGKYDGAFGVLASLLAVDRLRQQFGAPKRTLEVVALCEEEGSRFPISFWGSGSITGAYQQSDAAGLEDSSGVRFIDAMQQAGFGKGDYPAPARNDIACFIETHVEQGSTLELEQNTWAAVTHIVGQQRYTITLTGESNHAGTTPMDRRHDTVYAAARMIAHVIRRAEQAQNGLVATVGRIKVAPNVPNVVPGSCSFTLDIRHHQSDVINRFSGQAVADFRQQARKAGISIQITKWMDALPVPLDPKLAELGYSLAQKAGIPCKKMVSGAGHDSQIFGSYCPTALLFVPSHNGISHSPNEFTKLDDLETGVQMLMKLLHHLAY